jgi:endonuclease/exonuclease/phosphatase family metal-dependent hydrolase
VRVLTWNLFHGRAQPPAGHDLHEHFAALIAGWEWDVALLQEVPPWWPPALAERCDAEQRTAATSRNALPANRRFAAERHPDLMKSNGGGANAILVRGTAILEHRSTTLRRLPERRVCHAVRLAEGIWCANLHAQVHSDVRAQADGARGAQATLGWAAGAPALLGGDFNLRMPAPAGFQHAGGHGVDHVLIAGGLVPAGPARTLDRGILSDHQPVLVTLRAT